MSEYINQITSETPSIDVLRQELQAKEQQITNIKNEQDQQLDNLRIQLFTEKDIAREIGNKLEQKEITIQHCETKVKNLERALKSKMKEFEMSRLENNHNGASDHTNNAVIESLKRELESRDIQIQQNDDQLITLRKELNDKSTKCDNQMNEIHDLKQQLDGIKLIFEDKVSQKDGELKVLQKDLEFKVSSVSILLTFLT